MLLRPLSFEYPNDPTLIGLDNQFLLGPSLLITPVLEPGVDYVRGVFPGVTEGEKWYDYYTLQRVQVAPGENKTLHAPLEHINVHVRGGSVIPTQEPGYTTAESRRNPWGLLIALDPVGNAKGQLYVDDGESLVPDRTKEVKFEVSEGETLVVTVEGGYVDPMPLGNVTVAGMGIGPKDVVMCGLPIGDAGGRWAFEDGVLKVWSLELLTKGDGAWPEGRSEMLFIKG